MDWLQTRLSPHERALLDGVPGVVLGANHDKVHRSHLPLIEREMPATPVLTDARLRLYQAEGASYLRAREGALLADSCGLGKTRQVLAAVTKLPLVVVGPKIAVRDRGIWLAEVHEFMPGATTFTLTGRAHEDLPIVDVYLINYDILYQRWGQFLPVKRRIGTLVYDEAHKIVNRKAQRAQAALALSGCADLVYALTATPMPSMPANLFSILQCINPGAWGAYWEFTQRYADARPNSFGWGAKGLSHKEELRTRLREVMLQRFWFEVSDQVPDVSRERMPVELEPRDLRRYKAVEADLRLAIREGAKAAKLQQITALRKLCGLYKVPSVVDFVLDRVPDESVVIWIWHHEVANAIQEQLQRRHIECVRVTGQEDSKLRGDAIDRFQTKTVSVMLAQYEAAGVSADFTAARLAIMAELDWLPMNLQQAEGRTWRWKQSRACVMYYFLVENTVEEQILAHLWRKAGFTADALGDHSQVDVLSQIDEGAMVDPREEILGMIEAMVDNGWTGEEDTCL